MQPDIKEIVNSLGIPQKRDNLIKNRNRLLHLRYQMSQYTFNIKVGRYAFIVDEIDYLIKESKNCSIEREKEIYAKIKELEMKALSLQDDPMVQEYARLRDEYYNILADNGYYVTINIGLREELSKIGVPNIFVAGHELDYDKNIVDRSPVMATINPPEMVVILPCHNMESLRDYRHFYNKTSFKYLEELSKDCSFDLKGKNIGKVRTLTLKQDGTDVEEVW